MQVGTGEIDAYLAEVRRHPLLSRGEQLALARRVVTARESFRARALALPVVSLASPVPGHDSIEIGDLVADEAACDPVAAIARSQLARELPAMLAALDARERAVVEARFGLHGGDEETLGEVGRRLALSRERVRQIELALIGRMRRTGAARRGRRLASSRASPGAASATLQTTWSDRLHMV